MLISNFIIMVLILNIDALKSRQKGGTSPRTPSCRHTRQSMLVPVSRLERKIRKMISNKVPVKVIGPEEYINDNMIDLGTCCSICKR